MAAKGHEIFVIEPPPRQSNELNWVEGDSGSHPRIHVIDAPMPSLWQRHMPLDKLVAKGLYGMLVQKTAREVARSEDVDCLVLYNVPLAGLLRHPERPVLFDLCDDLPAMLGEELPVPGLRDLVERLVRGMADRADAVTVTTPSLLPLVGEREAFVVPNGASFPATQPERHPQKAAVYVGALEYFVDFPLLIEVARRLPEWTFDVIGAGRQRERILRASAGLKNFFVKPVISHSTLSASLDMYSTGLVPFRSSRVGRRASPLKAYEYLASGLSVVSTPVNDIADLDREVGRAIVRTAVGAGAFAQSLEEAFDSRPNNVLWRRVQRARSWAHLADRFIAALPVHGKVSLPASANL